MNYSELISLYFERTTALQNYWTLYVVIVGGVLAFSSLRKQPAAITTLIVSILFALFAYENLGAIVATTEQRLATRESIKRSTPETLSVRELLEPTMVPATAGSVRRTHLMSDILVLAGLWAMEFRRRKFAGEASSLPKL